MGRKLAYLPALALLLTLSGCESAVRGNWMPAEKSTRQIHAPVRESLAGEETAGVMVTYSTEHGLTVPSIPYYPEFEAGNEGLAWNCSCPVVEGVPGAAAINQAARRYHDTYMALIRAAGETWDIKKELDQGSPTSVKERQVGVWRADRAVVSLVYMDYECWYLGAHGYTEVWSAVFDAQTGQQLTLADLSDDEAALRQFAETYLLELSKTEFPEEIFFDGYEENIPNIIKDGRWGFTGDGLRFVANPYELASYSMGHLYFTIPYEDLKGHVDDKWLLRDTCRKAGPTGAPEVELLEAPPEDVLFTAPYPLDGETRWAVFTMNGPAWEAQATVVSNGSEIAWQSGQKLFWRGKLEAGDRFAVEFPYPIEETNYVYTTGLHLTYTTPRGERRTYAVRQGDAGGLELTETYGPPLP